MTANKRLTPRLNVLMPVQVRLVDPASGKPEEPSLPAMVVDVSAGGLRFEFQGITETGAQLLAAGRVLSVHFDEESLAKLSGTELTISWAKSTVDPASGVVRATIGGPFKQLSVENREILLAYSGYQSPMRRRPVQSGSATARLVVLVLILGACLGVAGYLTLSNFEALKPYLPIPSR